MSLRACEAISPFIARQTKKRDCRAALAKIVVIARNVAISPFRARQTEKRDCFAGSPLFVIARNVAISPFIARQAEKRDCFAGSPLFVIAKNVAISPFRARQAEKRGCFAGSQPPKGALTEKHRTPVATPQRGKSPGGCFDKTTALCSQKLLSSRGTWRSRLSEPAKKKREIASQARLYLSSRGTWRSRLSEPDKQKREIASQARLYLSSRGTWRSRLFWAGLQTKERLLRRLATPGGCFDKTMALRSQPLKGASHPEGALTKPPRCARKNCCHREERGDLACSGRVDRQQRDCFAGSQ